MLGKISDGNGTSPNRLRCLKLAQCDRPLSVHCLHCLCCDPTNSALRYKSPVSLLKSDCRACAVHIKCRHVISLSFIEFAFDLDAPGKVPKKPVVNVNTSPLRPLALCRNGSAPSCVRSTPAIARAVFRGREAIWFLRRRLVHPESRLSLGV